MKRNKSLLFAAAAVISILAVVYLSSTLAVEKKIEVETEYSLSDTRTEMDRAIDAYQQMINRLLESNENNNVLIISKLEAIQKDLHALSVRIEKIEKAVSSCQKSGEKNCAEKCAKKCKMADPNLPVPEQSEKK